MTKQQRKEIYWAAMFEIVAFGLRGEGICYAINKARPHESSILFLDDMKELIKIRPKSTVYPFWFPKGQCPRKRLECLSLAINLCESKTK